MAGTRVSFEQENELEIIMVIGFVYKNILGRFELFEKSLVFKLLKFLYVTLIIYNI